MSEAKTLFKMVIVLGIFFLFVGVLPGGSTPQAWQDFQSQMDGQNFPQFSNPYQEIRTADRVPKSEDPNPGIQYDDFPDRCNNVSFEVWECLLTNDGADSYVVLNSSTPDIGFNLTEFSGTAGRRIISAFFTAECLSTRATVRIGIILNQGTVITNDGFECAIGQFSVSTFIINEITSPTAQPLWRGDNSCNMNSDDCGVAILTPDDCFSAPPPEGCPAYDILGGGNEVWFSSFRVRVTYIADVQSEDACVGDNFFTNIGCAIENFGRQVWLFLTYVVNGLIYVFQVMAYGLTAAFNLVAGFFQMLAFLYALPNTPEWAQIVVDVFVTAALVYILFIIVKTIRGSEPG